MVLSFANIQLKNQIVKRLHLFPLTKRDSDSFLNIFLFFSFEWLGAEADLIVRPFLKRTKTVNVVLNLFLVINLKIFQFSWRCNFTSRQRSSITR